MIYSVAVFILFMVLIAYAVCLIYAIDGWQSESVWSDTSASGGNVGLTLVIPVRNAVSIPVLPANIPIIIVDDYSDNPIQYVADNVIVLRNKYQQGKKFALRYGIEHANTPYIVTSDIDVLFNDKWLDVISSYLVYNQVDMLVLPLKMSQPKSLFDALQETEYVALQTLTGGYALRNNPIMCSGANLVFKREQWLAAWNDIKPEIPSGDDMFMLHSFKRRGLVVKFLKAQEATLSISPAPSLKQLIRQHARWAGKAGNYADLATQLVAVVMLLGNIAVILCYPLVLIKWIIDATLLNTSHVFFNYRGVFWKSFLLSLVYPFYILVTLVAIPFNRKKW